MRAGLVRDHVGAHIAAHEFRQDLGGIAAQRHGDRPAFPRVSGDARQRIVEVARLFIDVARAQTEVDAALLAFDVQRARAGQGGGQRLRAPHAAQAGRQHPAARQPAVVVLAAGLDEGLVGALHDALAADVDPAARRHLAVHRQAAGIQFVEMLPGGPVRHQIGIGDQHARRVGVGLEHAHRLARLHQQCFVVVQFLERRDDLVVTIPVARGAADAAVHHQLLGVFGHVRVQVVHQHAQWRFGQPALGRQLIAARSADFDIAITL
ncbi:hypothetical protein D3C86_1086760 [compost metagenome]